MIGQCAHNILFWPTCKKIREGSYDIDQTTNQNTFQKEKTYNRYKNNYSGEKILKFKNK